MPLSTGRRSMPRSSATTASERRMFGGIVAEVLRLVPGTHVDAGSGASGIEVSPTALNDLTLLSRAGDAWARPGERVAG